MLMGRRVPGEEESVLIKMGDSCCPQLDRERRFRSGTREIRVPAWPPHPKPGKFVLPGVEGNPQFCFVSFIINN